MSNSDYFNYIEKSCDTCEFGSDVCMDEIVDLNTGEKVYGMPLEKAKKMYPNGCDGWGISLSAFETYHEKKAKSERRKPYQVTFVSPNMGVTLGVSKTEFTKQLNAFKRKFKTIKPMVITESDMQVEITRHIFADGESKIVFTEVKQL